MRITAVETLQIADALKDLDIYWHEDPVAMSNVGDLAEYKRRTSTRVAGSESLGTKTWYRTSPRGRT